MTGREIDPRYSTCRTWQHAWEPTTVERQGGEYVQGLRCLRCTTERFVKVNARTGHRDGNKYLYPEGYLLKGGGALTADERAEIRLAEVKGYLAARDELAHRRRTTRRAR